MIRSTPVYVAVNLVGALGAMTMLTVAIVSPSPHSLFPRWLDIGLPIFFLGYFVYQIFMRLTGRPIPLAPWAQGKSDRQIWIGKGVTFGALAVIALAMVFYHR